MEKTWKWFGRNDEITLSMLRQIGVEGVVTALYNIPCGEVWPLEAITELNNYIKDAGLRWSVVEDLPVSEAIRLGGENADKMIDNYVQSLANLGEAGINTVCYNFMPETERNTLTKENFKYFLSQLMPVCEEYNISMCINPRNPSDNTPEHSCAIISEDIEWILKAVDNPYNGLVFHMESSGTNAWNNILQQAEKFASHTRFIYLYYTDTIAVGQNMEKSQLKSREQLIELIRLFEKEKTFLPMCINNSKGSFQSRMYEMAQIDGTIATLKYEIDKKY